MPATCPHCGFVSRDEEARFCSSCGARMDGSAPAWYPAPGQPAQEQKNAMTAGVCSSLLPGLGQVYNGETARGFALFILTLAGLILLIVPGLIVWLYAMYDAWAVAGKMNAGTVPFRPTPVRHMVIFIVFAVIVVVIVILAIIAMVISVLMGEPGLPGMGTSANTIYNIF